MSAAWVAGSVRARAMAHRRVGEAGARALAASPSLTEAMENLVRSPYGQRVHLGDSLDTTVHGVASTLLWNLRVLAGWLPASGADQMRVLAGSWFELANVDEHLRMLAGRSAQPPFALGTLAIVWPELATASSRDELRAALAASPWGDPGGSAPRDVQLAMRLGWATRVAGRIPAARAWALGATALLVAREQVARQAPLPERATQLATGLLGTQWMATTTVPDLRAKLPARARWALAGVTSASELWRAEAGWWRRLRTDCVLLLGGSQFGPERIVGAIGLLAADAWLVSAALEVAARGPEALEVFNAVA